MGHVVTPSITLSWAIGKYDLEKTSHNFTNSFFEELLMKPPLKE